MDRLGDIKIVFIIDSLLGFAGTEKHLFETVGNLDRGAFSFLVISFATREWVVEEFKKRGVSVITLPLERIYGLNAAKQFRILLDLLKREKPDIVQTFHFKSDTFGVIAAKAAHVPYIISSRRDMGSMKKKSHLLLNRLINRLIHEFIAVCDAVAKTLEENERVDPRRVMVIHNGVDILRYRPNPDANSEIRKRLNIPSDAFVLGIVSNFRPEKGIHVFFQAAKILAKEIRELKIIAAGCGKSEVQMVIGEEVIRFCRKNDLLSRTVFPGYVRDVREYIPAMDVACLTPIRNEGFSNAIIEKMAMGKPVVASDVGGTAEAVIDGTTGFIVPPGNPELLAERILFLYKNKEIRERMGRNARARVEEFFRLEKMVGKMDDFYREAYRKSSNGHMDRGRI